MIGWAEYEAVFKNNACAQRALGKKYFEALKKRCRKQEHVENHVSHSIVLNILIQVSVFRMV